MKTDESCQPVIQYECFGIRAVVNGSIIVLEDLNFENMVTIQHPHRSERKRSSLWAVRGAPRLARPLHIVRIRPASKLAGTNFDNMQGG